MDEMTLIRKGVARNGFVLYALNIIDQVEQEGRFGTAHAYMSSLKSLVQFTGSQRIPFRLFRSGMLNSYENWLLGQGCCENMAHFYLRNLRALYNKAVAEKVIRPRENPFAGMSLESMPTRKRALPKRWVKRIKNLKLDEGTSLAMARDMFLFSFYTCGMGFADMILLKHEQLQREMIHYERVKTGRPVSVFANGDLLKIIEKYRTDSCYIWPVLSDGASEEAHYKCYRSALCSFNRHLKIIAEKANIPESLSSYMARHSWATAARNQLMPTAVISSCLGDANEKTTQIYLDSFNEGLVKRINNKVINLD